MNKTDNVDSEEMIRSLYELITNCFIPPRVESADIGLIVWSSDADLFAAQKSRGSVIAAASNYNLIR